MINWLVQQIKHLPRLLRYLLLISAAIFFCISYVNNNTQLSASAAELPKIQRRGYMSIAVKNNLRPLGFSDANGNLQGLEIDLATQLAVDLLGKPNAVKLQPVANRDSTLR